jgi:drug/metabolite transporter (DMT)-like permease
MMKIKEWAAFTVLGLLWGSSFLWIKIAVENVSPFVVVALRVAFGLISLLAVMYWQRQAIPRDRPTLLKYLFMGVFNVVVPFLLITWGETHIDSSLAAILNATTPLFVIVIAHFALHDEKITGPRLLGLIVGFVGVVVLVAQDFDPRALQSDLMGQLAVLLAAASYAVALVFSRRQLRNVRPVVQSTMILMFATAIMWVITPVVERPVALPAQPLAWVAVLWLGVLGLCAAYLLFFWLNNVWGPTRASLVTYVFPVVGVVLGVVFLNEALNWNMVFGSALVVGGIVVVNRKPRISQTVVAAASAK